MPIHSKSIHQYFLPCLLVISTVAIGHSSTPEAQIKLYGCWHLVRSVAQDPVEIEFTPNGEIFYSVESNHHWSIIKLTYKVEKNIIISDQPSHPQEQRTNFKIEKDGTLILELNGDTTRYHRGPKRAPKA